MQQDFANRPAVFPSAPPLDQPAPSGSFVKDALFLAVRESQRGDPAHARAQIKTAIFQLDNVSDPSERAYWQGQIDQATAYVEANAANADQLQVAAQQADATYVNGVRMTPAQLQDAVNDNADTQRALDNVAAGRSNVDYEVQPVARAAGKGLGNVTNAAASVVGGTLLTSGPFLYVVGAFLILVVVGALGYAYSLKSVAKIGGGK